MKKSLLYFLCYSLLLISPLTASEKGPVLLVVGTRPEVIKMFPVYTALKAIEIPTVLCFSGQHAQLAEDMLDLLKITPDHSLKIMKPNQDLFYITEEVLTRTRELFERVKPSLVIVQGDTTTAMAAALSAFYLKIPIGHVEAGLRSGNMYGPFPEEMNRRVISVLSSYHFAPTQGAVQQLLGENILPETIFKTGNTVVDALYAVRDKIHAEELVVSKSLREVIEKKRSEKSKILLLTAHRRESFGEGIQSIFLSLKKALEAHPNLYIVYPAHPNPQILKAIQETHFDELDKVLILPPLSYSDLAYLLNSVDGVATDSGGIQEEAASLNKPILILRNETDRPEAIEVGLAHLVGVDSEAILKGIEWMLSSSNLRESEVSPYGDGHAGQKIAAIVQEILKKQE